VNSAITNLRENLANPISAVLRDTENVYQTLTDNRVRIQTYHDQIIIADNSRFPIVVWIFLLPLIPMTIFIPSVIFAKRQLMRIVSICLGVIMVTMWTLFAVHLPMAATFGDSCLWLKQCEDEPEVTLKWTKAQVAITESCLVNASIVDALNLTTPLAYLDTLTFPAMGNISTYFNFSKLDQFSNGVAQLQLQDYQFDQDRLDSQLASLSVLCGTTYTEENIYTFAPVGSASEQFQEHQIYADVLTLLNLKQGILHQINDMNEQLATVSPTAQQLLMDAIHWQNHLFEVESLIQPIIVSGQTFDQLAYCGSIGDDYKIFKETWCSTLSTALAFLSLSSFAIAVSCVALIICSILEEKRISNPKNVDPEPPGRLSVDVRGDHQPMSRFPGSRRAIKLARQPSEDSEIGLQRDLSVDVADLKEEKLRAQNNVKARQSEVGRRQLSGHRNSAMHEQRSQSQVSQPNPPDLEMVVT